MACNGFFTRQLTVTYSMILAIFLFSLYLKNLFLVGSLQLTCVICFVLFVIIPLIFRYSYTLQRSMLFLNFVRWPRNFNFSDPEKIGLPGTRNFYVYTSQDVKLGVWHVLPESLINASRDAGLNDSTWYEEKLSSGKPVILYVHGNSGSRAATHRVELYKVLRALDYHVIAFDYRSYADSSPLEPSEHGLVDDAKFMFEWVEKHTHGKSPLFVWGHSLGTGVSSHALALLAAEGKESHGLFLEAPFNNMRDELRSHPLSQIFKGLPWFEQCFVQSVYDNGMKFDSDQHLANIRAPVAILHAEDDQIVPFTLGRKLYLTIQRERKKDAFGVDFWRFEAKLGLGHKFIYKDQSLPSIIKDFVQNSINMHNSSYHIQNPNVTAT